MFLCSIIGNNVFAHKMTGFRTCIQVYLLVSDREILRARRQRYFQTRRQTLRQTSKQTGKFGQSFSDRLSDMQTNQNKTDCNIYRIFADCVIFSKNETLLLKRPSSSCCVFPRLEINRFLCLGDDT